MNNLAKALGVQPRKSLGQNFLVDPSVTRRIVDAAGIQPGDLVVEIGPGLGALTGLLAERAGEVLAIELDQTLIPHLQTQLAGKANVRIIHADALKVDYAELCAGRSVRIVANLPYYITSHAIRVLLESAIDWRSIVLTVQLEVAQRVTAKPPNMSTLAVSVQYYGVPELLFRLPPSAFYPQPEVDSATLRINPLQVRRNIPAAEFFLWVKAGFSEPRKQLRNTIAKKMGISKGVTEDILIKSGITPERRPESITMQEWFDLVQTGVSMRQQSEL